MLKIFLLLEVVCFVLVSSAPIDYNDLGAWLTSELELNDQKAATDALEKLKTPWVSPKVHEDEPIDKDLLDKRDSLVKKLRNAQYKEGLEEIDQLLNDSRINQLKETNGNMREFELLLHEDRMIALKMQNRLIEALIEGQKMKDICSKPNGPSERLIEGLMQLLEADFVKSNDYNRLQVSYGAHLEQIKESHERIIDQLIQAEQEMPQSKYYFENVAKIVKASYGALTGTIA